MSAFRARIKAKARRTATYDLVVADEATLADAERSMAEAQGILRRADDDTRVEAQAGVEAATQALSACRDTITFAALPSHQFEALISAHEPTKAQQAKGDQWNPDTFQPALLAACCTEADMTEEEWAEELDSDRWSLADRNAIFLTALSVNISTRSVTLPKG